ncbi:hypothetical protein DFH11DRAFT_1721814 [Phellopilus nigrolimitatus]|nr:hypothetical protein DFH11DRAFT_1721814 [Phellopilus nigrolimitatus]
MDAPTSQKLTKKQRKGLAFRQKKGKGKPDAPGGDIPLSENQDTQDLLPFDEPPPTLSERKEKKGEPKSIRAREADNNVDVEHKKPPNKRKRDEGDLGRAGGAVRDSATENSPKAKKQKRKAGNSANEIENEAAGDTKENSKSRYILFVGNLKYSTSKEAILAHFALMKHGDPSLRSAPQVRLLTPKAGTPTKSKGCAFLEFSHRNALQQGLKLHQSELEGRMINVELTAGGGGKSDKRLNKVKDRNRGLATQRTKLLRKQHEAGGKDGDAESERPQRHSTTSGADQMPLHKRTWTVPEADDGSTPHRGGKKHEKKRGKRQKDHGTGVNAIPVG